MRRSTAGTKPPVVLERWTNGEGFAEVAALGGRNGYRVIVYSKRGDEWRRRVRAFPTTQGIPAFLKRLGLRKSERQRPH